MLYAESTDPWLRWIDSALEKTMAKQVVRVIDGAVYDADVYPFSAMRFRKSDGRQIGGSRKFALVPEGADPVAYARLLRNGDGSRANCC